MPNPLTEVQESFLRKYLASGLRDRPKERVGSDEGEGLQGSGDFVRSWDAARSKWQNAEEAVSGQIKALQGAFRKSGLPALADVANIGLPALTGNTRTKVMASVFDVERIKDAPDAKVLSRAEKNLAAMAQHLKIDPRIQACDTNPFGIKMSIAATLGGAIDQMRKALQDRIAA